MTVESITDTLDDFHFKFSDQIVRILAKIQFGDLVEYHLTVRLEILARAVL